MPRPIPFVAEARQQPRLQIAAMYSLLRLRKAGETRYRFTGHIYDVSLSGMRFEIDQPLEPGTAVEVRGMLPGQAHVTFQAAGTIVRFHDEDEVGPVRMGMRFESFETDTDQQRLTTYLSDRGLRLAA